MAALTEDDLREEFLSAIRHIVFQAKKSNQSRDEAIDQVAFSILTMIDGVSSSFRSPILLVAEATPAEEIEELKEEDGDWLEEDTSFNGSCYLHDLYYKK